MTLAQKLGVVLAGAVLLAMSSLMYAQVKKIQKNDLYPYFGVNLAGAEFAPKTLPGEEGKNYGWPTAAGLDYWKSKKVRFIRLPFSWERLQPTLKGEFDEKFCAGLVRTVKLIHERDMLVLLDVHNYNYYRGKQVGTEDVPADAFVDLWVRLAKLFKDDTAVVGYGLMNEPNGKGIPWQEIVQKVIDGIRSVDKQTMIFVPNDYPGWGAANVKGDKVAWVEKGMAFPDPTFLKDPSNNIVFEVHGYFDHDNSGTYKHSYQEDYDRTDGPARRVGPDTGEVRFGPFVEWLKKHKVKGFIGEYSVPAINEPGATNIDSRWLETLANAVAFFQKNGLPSTYWAGGEYWSRGNTSAISGNGWKSAEYAKTHDRPQLEILKKYIVWK